MVQLKSFKYIEPEASIEDAQKSELSGQDQDPGADSFISRASSSSSAKEPASSSSSISTIIGGNLTENDTSIQSDDQSNANQFELQSSQDKSTQASEEGTTTTLSSNEEYQLAEHDIIAEEGEEEKDESVTRIDIENAAPVNANKLRERGGLERKRLPKSLNMSQKIGSPRVPLSPRHQFYINRQHANSPNFGSQSPKVCPISPASAGNSMQNENVSQYSSSSANQRQNHFEIRWYNINLVAKTSNLPRFIAENPIYKFLKRNDDKNHANQFYYSPPMNHKISTGGPSQVQPSTTTTATTATTTTTTTAINKMTRRLSSTGSRVADNFQNSSLGTRTDDRPILVNVSGSVFSGQLTAILGPSGVGKTMLLNSLTGRNTLDGTGRVSLLGGASKRMSVVTVPQADVLPGKLTTLEDLRFTSRLKNPKKGFNHTRNIERIVHHLQMKKFLNTKIDKLSGGEERRLSIGRELLSSPDIMILDEPTSGLDANTCKKIITALRDIVEHSDNILDRPMSIIVTIHQPQQEVLNLFHRVYVMARGGRAIYEGPPTSLLSTLLENSSLSRVCCVEQLNENPAIVALEVASEEYGQNIISELALHHESQVYEESASSCYYYSATDGSTGGQYSPSSTPGGFRSPRKSPLSVSPRFEALHRAAARSLNNPSPTPGSPIVIGTQQTPVISSNRNNHHHQLNQTDHMSSLTNISFASTYDADLPEPTSRLNVDKRLRRSVVMKGDFVSHTITLMERCWLLTNRDLFLMSIRIVGFLMVAGGMVQIFSHSLDPNEHQCPNYESEVDDLYSYMLTTKQRLLNLSKTLKQASSTHLFFFYMVLCITMVTSALSGLVFPLQMRMFMREYKNGWYSPASFITSQTFAELPVDIIGPTLALLIIYPLCNQPTSQYYWRECGYILVIVISSIICKSQAQIVGAFLMDSVENSVFISCVMMTPPALLSGIAVRVSQMSALFQILSYGSFLRYAFESFFLLRYGYGICPCDPDIINGYPIKTTAGAIPPQMDNMARGFIELHKATNITNKNITDSIVSLVANETATLIESSALDNDDNSNLFLKFVRIVTDASNMFPPKPSQMGDCDNYRSLYLMDMNIKDHILPEWIAIMVSMFIMSRFLTYFIVKTVIKNRKH